MSEQPQTAEHLEGQPNRREVLTKLGLGAAAAWTAPLLLSSAAAAQGSVEEPPPPPQPILDIDHFAPIDGTTQFAMPVEHWSDPTFKRELLQPFVAGRSGELDRAVVFGALESASELALSVILFQADPGTGLPVGDVLGTGMIPQSTPYTGNQARTAAFAVRPTVTAGTTYAFVFGGPSAIDRLPPGVHNSWFLNYFSPSTISGFGLRQRVNGGSWSSINGALRLQTYVA